MSWREDLASSRRGEGALPGHTGETKELVGVEEGSGVAWKVQRMGCAQRFEASSRAWVCETSVVRTEGVG